MLLPVPSSFILQLVAYYFYHYLAFEHFCPCFYLWAMDCHSDPQLTGILSLTSPVSIILSDFHCFLSPRISGFVFLAAECHPTLCHSLSQALWHHRHIDLFASKVSRNISPASCLTAVQCGVSSKSVFGLGNGHIDC